MQENNLPNLTPEQRAEALAKAARARHERAALRDDIKAGKVSLTEVFEMEDDIARRMKVSALIEAMPGYGKAKAAKIMKELGISESRRIQGLGENQKANLLDRLGNN